MLLPVLTYCLIAMATAAASKIEQTSLYEPKPIKSQDNFAVQNTSAEPATKQRNPFETQWKRRRREASARQRRRGSSNSNNADDDDDGDDDQVVGKLHSQTDDSVLSLSRQQSYNGLLALEVSESEESCAN